MVSVVIYTRQFCGYCAAAKALLEKKGVDFVEHDATGKPELRAEMIEKSRGRNTFPQIFIGGQHVGGCDEMMHSTAPESSILSVKRGMTMVKVAAVQMCSGDERRAERRQHGEAGARGACAGAIYVQTPEMTGALMRDKAGLRAILRPENDGPCRGGRCVAGPRARHPCCMSARPRSSSTTARSPIAACCSDPTAGWCTRYDKIHMFDVDLDNGESWRESATYRPGERRGDRPALGPARALPSATTCASRSSSARERRPAPRCMTVPAAFTRQTGEAHWEVLLRARAIENGAFVIAAAQGGSHEDGRETFGHSMIIDPWGRVLASRRRHG